MIIQEKNVEIINNTLNIVSFDAGNLSHNGPRLFTQFTDQTYPNTVSSKRMKRLQSLLYHMEHLNTAEFIFQKQREFAYKFVNKLYGHLKKELANQWGQKYNEGNCQKSNFENGLRSRQYFCQICLSKITLRNSYLFYM